MSHFLTLCRIGAHAVVRVHDVLAGRVEELVGVVLTDEFIAVPIARPMVDLVRVLLAAKTDRHEGLPRNQTERNRIGSVFFSELSHLLDVLLDRSADGLPRQPTESVVVEFHSGHGFSSPGVRLVNPP